MNKNRGSINYDGKIAGLYDLGDTLGRGHFAVVKLARHVFTGEQVAVKVIDKTKLDEVSRAHLFQEVRCMKLVQHPNVVRLYEVIDTQTKLYLILELGDGGDMYDYIMKHEKGVDEETAKRYFRQIVNAISYCHKLHVVHRDLKPENVVFFEKLGVVKLTDFGFSNKFCPGQKLETSCGSLAYSAPEILLGDSYDAPKVDVWSLGVILYMMVCGHAPFQEANDSETLTMIMDCKYTIPSYISDECRGLIERMLIRDPDKRATLEQIASDTWLTFGYYSNSIPECLPLVSREHLSEEDHTHIIQKMVNGNIATKEEILESLDKNDYNHITATYFLLAERKLRLLRYEKAQFMNNNNHASNRLSRPDLSPIAVTPGISSAAPSPAQEKLLTTVDGLISPCLASNSLVLDATSPLSSNVQRLTSSASSGLPMMLELPKGPTLLGRKCSIVREEEDSSASASNSPTKSPSQDISSRLLIVPEQLGKIVEDTGGMSLSFSENSFNFPDTNPTEKSLVQSTMPSTTRQKLSLPVSNSATALRNMAKDQTGNFNSPSKSLAGINPIRTAGGSQSPLGLISPGSVAKCKTLPSPGRRLHSVQSSPHLLLNEINEDDRDSDTGSTCVSQLRHHRSAAADQHRKKQNCYLSKLQSHGSAVSHAMLRIMGKRHKFVKNRTASCSSSDASDDEENLKRRMGKLKLPNSRKKDGDNHDGNGNSGNNGGGHSGDYGGDGAGNGGDSGNDRGGAGGSNQDKGSQGYSKGSGNSSPNMDSLDLSQTEDCLYEEVQSAHLSHVVFSTDSTDSLDLISEPQPRLVSSVSCGDLSSGEVAQTNAKVCYSVSEAEDLMVSVDPVVRIEAKTPISVIEGHQVASRKTSSNKTSVSNTPSHKNREIESIGTSVAEIPSIAGDISLSAKLRSKLSNSLSLNSGLSCLQNANSTDSLAAVPSNKNSGGRSTPKSPLKQQQLDINQNGWKKHGKQAKSVVDVKMASKCCTLC